ncbi:MAG: methyl-accepting chemotaxis protein [Nitrospirae bacterium]|nr:methyl-accepting chemotaxis protein [Nitrospirota bacterium]
MSGPERRRAVRIRLSAKIALSTAVALVLVLGATYTLFYRSAKSDLSQIETGKMTMMGHSIVRGLGTIMYSVNAPALSQKLVLDQKTLPGIVRVQVLRPDGTQSFYDNLAIEKVNSWRHYKAYSPRMFVLHPKHQEEALARDPRFQNVVKYARSATFKQVVDGKPVLTRLFPIRYEKNCALCHGYSSREPTLAVLRVSMERSSFQGDLSRLKLQAAIYALATIGILLLLLVVLVRMIAVRPLGNLVTVIGRTAEGDLTQHLTSRAGDEVGDLVNHFGRMVDNLRDLVQKVANESECVGEGSRNMIVSLESIRGKSTTQMQQIETAKTAVDELGRSLADVAQVTRAVSEISARASQEANTGGETVSNMVRELSRIEKVISDAGEKILDLGKRSDQISQIVNIINEIAEQTNLLALNAAIEAARAGEQGRGFAVVADEVRKLAERTTRSTREISETISQLQGLTEQSVKVMDRGSKEMKLLIGETEKTAEVFTRIVASSSDVSRRVNQIAETTGQQTQAIARVEKVVDQTARDARETVENVSGAVLAGEGLQKQMEELNDYLSRFKV